MCRNNYYHYGVIVDTIMDYIGKQTVSKYPTSAECKAARFGAEGVLYAIEEAPAADVEEVKHGRWVKDTSTADVCAEYRCSLCGYFYCEADPKQPPFKYCPECGAKNE